VTVFALAFSSTGQNQSESMSWKVGFVAYRDNRAATAQKPQNHANCDERALNQGVSLPARPRSPPLYDRRKAAKMRAASVFCVDI
jgi:hypothetical protein